MYTGGIADKFGNRYEAKILVYKVLEVLEGELDWIHFEGITEEFTGFEFSTGKKELTEWYQTKISSSQGNWTIKRLCDEGVLEAFTRRLDSDGKCVCYFISEHPAKELASFSNKARISNSLDEYLASLSPAQQTKFTDISAAWEANKETTFDNLRRTRFVVWPQYDIEANTRMRSRCLFSGPQHDFFPIVREFLEENVNRRLTTELVREFFISRKFKFKSQQLSPTLKQRLAKTTKRYLDSYQPFGAGGTVINRKETAEVLRQLKKEEGPKVILLTGGAGTGKSGIVRAIISFLTSEKIIHLAFRVDQHLDCTTPEEIGSKIIGADESPVVTLQGISPYDPSILIVDQVDAVSEVSGRNGVVKNAVLELLDGLAEVKTKVIYVCRDFDLENDARLKNLERRKQVKRVRVELLDWKDEIEPVFTQKGIDTSHFTKAQKELLILPLNLSLFLSIGEEKLEFSSRNDLFDALIKKKQRELGKRDVNWTLLSPLSHLSKWMSDRQTLSAPSHILGGFPLAEEILASESLIVIRDNQVNFFHESFFDYVYARSFLESDQSLIDLLSSTEQHLFRRTQVRQILEVLRQYDYNRYLEELKSLFCKKVRYHIKIAIAQWLGSLKKPTIEEMRLGISLNQANQKDFSRLSRTVLFGAAGWVDMLVESDWILDILNGGNEHRKNTLLWWLLRIAHERPDSVAKILRVWWDGQPEKAYQLIKRTFLIKTGVVGRRIQPLEDLYCDLINASPEYVLPQYNTRQTRDDIFYSWVRENVGGGSAVLKTYFKAWFKLNPNEHPFSFQNISKLDLNTLSEAAQANPGELILGLIDALNISIDRINERKIKGLWDDTFKSFNEGECYGDDKLVKSLRLAFKKVAKHDPKQAGKYLEYLDPRKHKLFLHLHLETYIESPLFFKQQFFSLFDCRELLSAGCSDIEWKSFANMAKHILPHADDAERLELEFLIRSHTPKLSYALKFLKENGNSDRKWILKQLNESGYEQWCILETIGESLLSDELLTILLQLRRKFRNRTVGDQQSFSRAWEIFSPISEEHAVYMSDQQWLQAIEKYASEHEREKRDGGLSGGARQLSDVLCKCAKQAPDRFSVLLLKIPMEANSIYQREILHGLSRSDGCSIENLKKVIDHVGYEKEEYFHLEISRMVERYPSICEEKKYLELLIHYASNGSVDRNEIKINHNKEKEDIVTIEQVIRRTNDAYVSGINDVRGAAVRAISKVYWRFPDYSATIESFIRDRIENEASLSVRCVMIDILLPFYNYDREKCGRYYDNLITETSNTGNSANIIACNSGIRLIKHVIFSVPDIGKKLVTCLLKSNERYHQLIGAWLVFSANYQLEGYEELFDDQLQKGVEYRRLAAQVTAQYFTLTKFREIALDRLVHFFNDTDEQVQSNAAMVFREIEPHDIKHHHDLLEEYVAINMPHGDYFDFFRMLKKAASNVDKYVIQAAEKLVFELKENPTKADSRRRDITYLDELLQSGYVSSEHNPGLRTRYLDIIDSLLELEVYGSERIVESYDRHL